MKVNRIVFTAPDEVATDTVELWIRCTDVTTSNATLRDVNLSLHYLGP